MIQNLKNLFLNPSSLNLSLISMLKENKLNPEEKDPSDYFLNYPKDGM